ncbi:MAG: zinc ribbon domain-containing protein [Planctomycetota bacterium]
MVCRFQCAHCHEVLSVSDRLVGRSIRCPFCHAALTVPEADPERLFLEFDFSEQIESFALSQWDRACAHTAHELKMATPDQIRKALIAVRRAEREDRLVPLDEELLLQGALDHGSRRAIQELVKGTIGRKDIDSLRECPNCFASVSKELSYCRFCGQKLSDFVLYEMCPNCKNEQPVGHEWCRTCKAGMKTGLLPGMPVPRCPHCGYVIYGKSGLCPNCRERLDRSRLGLQWEAWMLALSRWWENYSFATLLIVLVGGGFLVHTYWFDIKSRFVGAERAMLDERVQAFATALRASDMDMITKMLDPLLKLQADEKLRSCILGGPTCTGRVESVEGISIQDVVLEKNGTEATVYAKNKGTLDLQTVEVEVTSSANLADAAKTLGKSHFLSGEVPWKWVLRGDDWYYQGPVPSATAEAETPPAPAKDLPEGSPALTPFDAFSPPGKGPDAKAQPDLEKLLQGKKLQDLIRSGDAAKVLQDENLQKMLKLQQELTKE